MRALRNHLVCSLLVFLSCALVSPACAEELPVSLVPERELGSRQPGYLRFDEIIWNADSEWFHKPAPVCRVVERPMDLSRIVEEAKKRGMVANEDHRLGPEQDGPVDYKTTEPPWLGAGGIARKRYFYFGAAKFRDFERDENQFAIVEPLASREENVKTCREWMKRLGIDENELYRGGDWPGGFEVEEMIARVGRMDPETKETVYAHFGQHLRFSQQIGGLPAFWSGSGGNLLFRIADGGEFCGIKGCLRAWEKIGDYEVLDRLEVEAAVKEGFAWVHDPINCKRLEVVEVGLSAYHSDWRKPQRDFPLIYTLRCQLHGGPQDGETKTIQLPALRQHRHGYGPRPESAVPPGEPLDPSAKQPDPGLLKYLETQKRKAGQERVGESPDE